ncbi:uncharacterized protein LOC126563750 [Anopheles maculipalpis]|uniref:uncharacterized protein LOC126563750 n=1 Tax=Anopheles maculipalpis TaxID=1496333 RepID=UPI00215956B1|nr:uncharacterized protein LOC126563750 [Anopheles maculipalpis]
MGTNHASGILVSLLILATHCAVILAAPSTGHGYETKSFPQAYLECLQYLNITRQSIYAYNTTAVPSNTGGNCLMRCIGLNTRWWNDETGLNEKALVRFFRQTDPNSLEQARTCLATVSNASGTCDAAYRTFRCYSDALGEVIAHPEYVAPCRAEIQRAVSDCATMLQISDGQLASCVGTETFLHGDNSTALLRCVVLRLGIYADSTGVDCDRLQLLMDSDTAESWSEAHAEEAKRCEKDLRELGADVCVVAAHSVEICYGWRAFAALWQVLKEEYGESDNVIVKERMEEPLVESNDVKKEKMEEGSNDIKADAVDVEVFSYPSGARYRSLLMIAPKWIALDVASDSDSSSSEEDSTPENDKPEVHELETDKLANSDNAVKQEITPEPEEPVQKDPEAYHVVHTRSVMYPMPSEVYPYCRPVLPPYVSRIRRSYSAPHYHPHDIPMMGNRHFHPMSHPVVKRSIPMEPMFAPAQFVPMRFVREAVGPSLETVPAESMSEATASDGQQDQLVPLFDADFKQEELLKLAEVADGNLNDGGESDAYEEQSVADATPNNEEDHAQEAQSVTVSKTDETLPTNVADVTSNVGEDKAQEEQAVAVLKPDESLPTSDDNGERSAFEVMDLPAAGDGEAAPEFVDTDTAVGGAGNEVGSVDSTNPAVASADADKTETSAPESQNRPVLESATSADNAVPPVAQPPSSNTVATEQSNQNEAPAPKAIHPHTVQRLIRAVHASNMMKTIISVLKKH